MAPVIRFKPDGWVDVVMRPFDMVSPESGVHVEIGAPDIRMAAAVILGLLALLFWRRLNTPRRPVVVLLALTAIAFVPWLVTTGNGRYFIAFLVLSGPLCLGLVRLLPVSQPMRLTVSAMIVAIQAFLVVEVLPFKAWGWVDWRDAPYFEVDSPPMARDVTYVTISSISYSLLAPQFPPEVSWMNASSGRASPRDAAMVRQFLASGRPLVLVAPTMAGEMLADGRPSENAVNALNGLLRLPGLSIKPESRCDVLRSKGMAHLLEQRQIDVSMASQAGFWLCPLQLGPAASTEGAPPTEEVEGVFVSLERLCPRFFPPGGSQTMRINGGYLRSYADSDTRAYVLDDGQVRYKYWRSVNAVSIGDVEAVRSGRVSIDCTKIRTPNWRTGGP